MSMHNLEALRAEAQKAYRKIHKSDRVARFWARVHKTEGCWLWLGPVTFDGYGQFHLHGEHRAHRVSARLANIEIPDGMIVMHVCDNPPCVNPEHLRVGTVGENNADRDAKGRTANCTRSPEYRPLRGEANGTSKLTEAKVVEIRAARLRGETTVSLAARYGVSNQVISYVANRKSWRHVP